jgi:aminopeptidase N
MSVLPPLQVSRFSERLRLVLSAAVLLIFAWPAAAQRLPSTSAPEHYELQFAPDLDNEVFDGHAVIRITVRQPTAELVLNAADLIISQAVVSWGGARHDAAATLDESAETVTLRVPQTIPAGPAELDIRYRGRLNRELRGFYISEANGRKYAVTQLEATDARRMFPGYDEPAYKATFDISALIDRGDTAISNGAITSTDEGPSPGKKLVHFAKTARMSTYLVALAVGDFACAEGRAGDTPLRVCGTPDKKALTGFAMEAAQASIEYFNRYFGIEYPFGKLDLVGIPDFAAGAMENVGAVFFREALLLVPDTASLAVRKQVAIVIAHELAHQWFGDLVTMQWWDDIWLNEGFATWMESKAIAAWKPDWHLELDEVQDTQAAMATDALAATRPIRTEVDTPAQIEGLFDAIAYQKTAAVLRMVESFVEPNEFQAGVRAYLHAHEYGNAAAEDFWTIVARTTNKPVDRIMETFVDRPGVPLVTVDASCAGDSTELRLSQERLQAERTGVDAEKPWVIPVCVEAPGGKTCDLVDERHEIVKLHGCMSTVMANAGADGYYRAQYGADALQRLGAGTVPLTSSERLMLIGDEWALVRAGRSDVNRFLALAAALAPRLHEPVVLSAMSTRLRFVHEHLTTDQNRRTFEAWVVAHFKPPLDKARADGTVANDAPRLAVLVKLVGDVGRDSSVLAEARQAMDQYLAAPMSANIDPDLLDAYVSVAALTGDAGLYDRYKEAASRAKTPAEQYRFLYALAGFRVPALIGRTIDYALSPAVRAQDRAGLIARLLRNPDARVQAWEAIQARWPELQKGLGAFGGTSAIIGALDSFCDREHRQQIEQFFAEHPVPRGRRTLAQTLEHIDTCAALADEQRPVLSTALD